MYDSLDTMLLMGLHDEFSAALTVVQSGDFSKVRLVLFVAAFLVACPRSPARPALSHPYQ